MNDSFLLHVPEYIYGIINLKEFVPILSLSRDFHSHLALKTEIFFQGNNLGVIIRSWPFWKEISLTIFHGGLGNLSRYRCSICLFSFLIPKSWNPGKELWWRGPGGDYKGLPAGSPFLLFPESKNPGREMMGTFNKSPKNKEMFGKIGLQFEDYL